MIDRSYRFVKWLALFVAIPLLTGCGGGDFMPSQQNSLFGNNLTGNYTSSSGFTHTVRSERSGNILRGAYPMVEISFQLPHIQGNPFDFNENDVKATISEPNGSKITLPAFFDGGDLWKVRFTPLMTGRHQVTEVTLNGAPVNVGKMENKTFQVTGKPSDGFIKISTNDPMRFVFDDGKPYYPIGNDLGWGNGKPGYITSILDKMGKAGENWSRIWMCAWDNLNLDWGGDSQGRIGYLRLDVAKRWDHIISTAQRDNIHIQLVLQYHGEYSTTTNSNWNENPWNKKNGGFLNSPEEFFTNPKAIALTEAKFRYIIARWGYSPAIMAWEIFNEVQWTDAISHHDEAAVGAWHKTMADFIRSQDPYHHLVTTSSDLNLPIWEDMDYLQPHEYVADPLATFSAYDAKHLAKPWFMGETGPNGDMSKNDGPWLEQALWGGMMSDSSGAAEFWAWDAVDSQNLYPQYLAATTFMRLSRFPYMNGIKAVPAAVKTDSLGVLSFGPGGGWGAEKTTDYTVSPSGTVNGIGEMPSYLQGDYHRTLTPYILFHVDYVRPGAFSVTIRQVAKAGATLDILVDGQKEAEKVYPEANQDTGVNDTLQVKVPAGSHDIKLVNTGNDWVVLGGFTLDPYAPAIGALAKTSRTQGIFWVYNRGAGDNTTGELILNDIQPGDYQVHWFNPSTASEMKTVPAVVAKDGAMKVSIPAFARDLSGWFTRK